MLSQPSRTERTLLLLTVFLAPFFFVQIAGKFVAPWDFIYIIVVALYALRTGSVVLGPTRRYVVGVFLFVTAMVLSLTNSPFPLNSFLDGSQYYLIFLAVIPACSAVFAEREDRWLAYLVATLSLQLVAIVYVGYVVITHNFSSGVIYGNVNIIAVLIAAAAILAAALAVTPELPASVRVFGAGAATVDVFAVLLSPSGSGYIMLAVAGWFLLWRTTARSSIPNGLFWIGSAVAAVLGSIAIVVNWQKVYNFGFYNRWPMYKEAFLDGLRVFPFGGGMSSADIYLADLSRGISREVHNVWLSHWLEFGLLGLLATVLIFLDWPFATYRAIEQRSETIPAWEFSLVALFGAYFVQQQFQPAPLTRFWWIIFALSWLVLDEYQPTGDGATYPKVEAGRLSTMWQSAWIGRAWRRLSGWAQSSTIVERSAPPSIEPVVLTGGFALRIVDRIGDVIQRAWSHSTVRRVNDRFSD